MAKHHPNKVSPVSKDHQGLVLFAKSLIAPSDKPPQQMLIKNLNQNNTTADLLNVVG